MRLPEFRRIRDDALRVWRVEWEAEGVGVGYLRIHSGPERVIEGIAAGDVSWGETVMVYVLGGIAQLTFDDDGQEMKSRCELVKPTLQDYTTREACPISKVVRHPYVEKPLSIYIASLGIESVGTLLPERESHDLV